MGNRRIGSLQQLQRETAAWAAHANATGLRIRWTFTTAKARQTFGYERMPKRLPAAAFEGDLRSMNGITSWLGQD